MDVEYPWMNVPFVKEFDNIPKDLKNCDHAAHALLHCTCTNLNLFGWNPMKYAVMVQLRHDGMLGFPGGYVDVQETIKVGLNRELYEEINLSEVYSLSEIDYHGAWIHKLGGQFDHTLVDHFYVKQYSEKDFLKIEKAALSSKEWGKETLGILRVPLHEMDAFANFLNHNFVGNARDQLVSILIERGIFTSQQINTAWTIANKNLKAS